jgi:hypothetical protein
MKEKDYIEELIEKNLKELNENEPPEGHFDRFEARLKGLQQKRSFSLRLVWKIAAAAVFAFLVVNQAVIWFSDRNVLPSGTRESGEMTLASVSSEYEEVEFFYTNAINVGLTQWEKLAGEGLISEEEQRMMNSELEDFEKTFRKLQEDLSRSPEDERVINAMIEYYQTKLSLIRMIIERLEEVKQINHTENETEI